MASVLYATPHPYPTSTSPLNVEYTNTAHCTHRTPICSVVVVTWGFQAGRPGYESCRRTTLQGTHVANV